MKYYSNIIALMTSCCLIDKGEMCSDPERHLAPNGHSLVIIVPVIKRSVRNKEILLKPKAIDGINRNQWKLMIHTFL